jgi:hypothetical protein
MYYNEVLFAKQGHTSCSQVMATHSRALFGKAFFLVTLLDVKRKKKN